MLRHAIINYKNATASRSWSTTDGEITDVRLWGKRNIDGKMSDAEKLAVAYTYKINGFKYTGKSIAFYTLVYPKTMELAERYSNSSNVKIYYDPEDPAESVLVPGLNPDKPYSELIMGSLGVATGIVIAILA